MKNLFRWALMATFLTTLTVGMARVARADQLIYWTNWSGQQLMQTDVTLGTTTAIDNTPVGAGTPDSLIFDSHGDIIYSEYNGNSAAGGEVRMYNPTANTDTLIASGFSNQLVDLQLDPSGTSVLVSDRGTGQVVDVSLTGGPQNTLAYLNAPNGIAYDGNGNLYVADGKTLDQINTTNGQVITSVTVSGSLDGLTYNAANNTLYAASGSCLQTFTLTGGLAAGNCVGSFSSLDGVESGGDGNIYVADTGAQQVGAYNVTSRQSSYLFSAPHLDDIAPIVGLGAPPSTGSGPSVPEPTSLISMVGLSLIALVGLRRRQTSS
jgi:sugar lactone lactonase YvrE